MSRINVLLHRVMHQLPGVPSHVDRPAGHQGRSPRLQHRTRNHSAQRPPKVMVGWQRRIAAFFGQQLP